MRLTALFVFAISFALGCESGKASEPAPTAEDSPSPSGATPTGKHATPATADDTAAVETVPAAATTEKAADEEAAAEKAAPESVAEAPAKDGVAKSQPSPASTPARAGADRAGQGSKPDTTEAKAEAPTPKAVPWKSGGRADDVAFSVWLEGPAEVVINAPTTARARVVAKEPYKCNEKYPAKFRWESQDGVSVGSAKVGGMNVAGKNGTLALPFSAVREGPVTLSGTLSFSVCTKENCRVEKRKLQLSTKAIPQG